MCDDDDELLGDFWGEYSADEDDDGFAPPAPSEETHGQRIVSLLLEHYLHSRLSATQCVTLMHHLDKVGIKEAHPYSLDPNSSGGHHSRKLKSALGHDRSDDLYEADLPGHSRHDLQRTSHKTSFLPLHEQLADHLGQHPEEFELVKQRIKDGDTPPCFKEHEVVVSNPSEVIVPIALFIDAVPYSETDSVMGCWGMCLLSGRRFLISTIRKRNVCRCGCAGWCTWSVLFSIASWSLSALAEGKWPSKRHDSEAWRASDCSRSAKSGSPLPKCACVYLKADWAEYATTAGLPTWGDGYRPCFACSAFGPNMFVAGTCGVDGLRWKCNEVGDFDRACASCETKVLIETAADRDMLVRSLVYDKSKSGNRGRCLYCSVEKFKLREGDRLEPSSSLPDVGALEEARLPLEVTFWRKSEETLCRHRNMLWQDSYGMSIEKMRPSTYCIAST